MKISHTNTVTKRRLKLTITTTRRTLVRHQQLDDECEAKFADLSQTHGVENPAIRTSTALDALIRQLDTRGDKA